MTRGKEWIVLVLGLGLVSETVFAEPNWAGMSYTPHKDYQAVDADGVGTFSLADPVKTQGVILNWPSTMLNPKAGSNPFMGGQWQIYVQATDTGDFGGTACWMGQNIGKLMGQTHPDDSYTDSEWCDELQRLNYESSTGRRFRPGDLIEIRARAPGMFFNGKTNINEQHNKDPLLDFDIVLLQADYGMPTAEVIGLDDVKDGIDNFIFDQTRATGAEHYQGSAVEFQNVSFVSTANWGPDGALAITDGTRTMPVKLGRGYGFSRYPAPTGTFNITGIFDQEDGNGADGYKAGYRLWVMDYDDGSTFVIRAYAPPDFDEDGFVDSTDFSHFAACASGPAVPHAGPSCEDADFDGDGDVDMSDFATFQVCLSSGTTNPVDPMCWE